MARVSLILLCWALAFQQGYGYLPSHHPSGSVDTAILRKKFSQPTVHKTPTENPRRVRLEPVLKVNPLEHQKRIEEGLSESKGLAPETIAIPAQPAVVEPTAITARYISQEEERNDIFVSASAVLVGFTDVLCLAQFGCFVNMMTGNLLKMTSAVVNGRVGEALVHATFVLCYMIGVVVFARIKASTLTGSNDAEKSSKLAPVRWVAPIVAVLFTSADLLARYYPVGMSRRALQVPFLAMGFGVVNSAAAHATGGTIFFAMTGHLTKITNTLNEIATTKEWNFDVATRKSLSIVRNFLGGAALAAFLVRHKATVTLPVCTTLGILYATLFGWYAPMTLVTRPSVTGLMAIKMAGRKIASVSRRFRQGFARVGTKKPALIPSPIVVDILPPHQDFALATNGTLSGL